MSVSAAREVAWEAVVRVRERTAYAPPVLDALLAARDDVTPQDAAFARWLTYGTLQALGVLEEAVDARLRKPGSLEPRVRDALLVGAYELLLGGTAPHAAVSQWVDQVRSIRPAAAGLANAVLRRIGESAADFPWGDPETDIDALARKTLHPRWVVDLLMADLGEQAALEALSADAEPAPLYLWHNPFKGPLEAVLEVLREAGAEPEVTDPPGCIRCGHASPAIRSRAVTDGLALVTDAGAQVAALVLGPQPGARVVDAAAGRGTKTAQIQAMAVAHGAPAEVIALDVHAFKTQVLAERLEALNVPGVHARTADVTDPAASGLPAEPFADAVLVDAPCSGLGTLRRRPEKRWRLRPGDLNRLARLQGAILAGAASLVNERGVLVYSTCSPATVEDEGVVAAFLEAHPDFARTPLDEVVPASMRRFLTPVGDFRSWPTLGGPDGHYVARLVRL